MAERGNTKHNSELDDQLQHEDQPIIQGNKAPHAEDFRETEPFPDETDDPEVQAAMTPVREQLADREGGSTDE